MATPNLGYLLTLPKFDYSFVVIVGPSCPLSPVLFNYGVDVLAGAKVVEAEAVIEGISQGATLRQVKGIKLLAMKR